MDFLRKFGKELPIVVTVLEEEMEGRAERIGELEKQLADLEESNDELRDEVNDLEEQNRQMQDELALAETRIEELEARNEYEVAT